MKKRKLRGRFSGQRLKKSYKRAIKRQLEKEFLILSKSDINEEALFVHPLNMGEQIFIKSEEQEGLNTPLFVIDDVLMQNGYASASLIMLRIVKSSDNNFVRDSYIKPIMFCFRQFLELTMKDSLLRFRDMRRKASKDEVNVGGHNLSKLWDGLKKYFDIVDDEVKCVEKIIYAIQEVDKEGTLFRYNEYLNEKFKGVKLQIPLIDIDVLETCILQSYRFFEGINEMVRKAQDEKTMNYY